MARIGETIENPVTGERITWIETAQSTGGELLAFELHLRPGAAVSAEHRHVLQAEDFTVLEGTVVLEVAGNPHPADPGQQVTVPIGVAHRWWNIGQQDARVRVELRPALDTETFFENILRFGSRWQDERQRHSGTAADRRCDSRAR